MVTVELAVGVLTLALLTATLAGLVLLGVVQTSCSRTATEVARQLARGDQQAAAQAQQEGPAGCRVTSQRQQDGVQVEVTCPARVRGLGALQLHSSAWSRWEPGVTP